jgi:tetratricopeptide (TPR) repeat protein
VPAATAIGRCGIAVGILRTTAPMPWSRVTAAKQTMAVNRETTVIKAEKLVQQGKLAEAIAEYARFVADDPRDWSTINTLGDLYLRAGDPARAVEQFAIVADHLFGEGFLARSAALYKKALKAKPDHDHSLSRLAAIAVTQGLTAEARTYLRELSKRRALRGDSPGVDECDARLASMTDGGRQSKLQIEDWSAPVIEASLEPGAAAPDVAIEENVPQSSPVDLALAQLYQAIESGDDRQIRHAQAELCDIYLEAGQGVEARILATDLVAQEPESAAHAERLKWAHELLGTDPPASIGDPVADLIAFDAHAPEVVAVMVAADVAAEPPAIEAIFEKLRDDVAREHRELAAEQYERGVKKVEQGNLAEAIQDLDAATRTAVRRFVASASLGRKLVADGELRVGVEWLEQAAAAMPPNANERHSLLYDLADTLERVGENERALTILRTLEEDAGEYEDVRARIARLSQSPLRSSKP